MIALIGDVGGTNVRLALQRLNFETRTFEEVIPLTKLNAQKAESFEACVREFLADVQVDSDQWPQVGVIGIAGAVQDNTVHTTNIPHWPVACGVALSQALKIEKFVFINDFKAAGYGCLLYTSPSPRDATLSRMPSSA